MVWTDRYLDHLTVERGLSTNTLAAYRRDLRRYVAFCAKRDITAPDDVDEATIRSFVASISASTWGDDERPYSARSVARALSSVRSFHRFLLREGAVDRDPASAIVQPKLPRSLPHPLAVDEVVAALGGSRCRDARRTPGSGDPRGAVRRGAAHLGAGGARRRRRRSGGRVRPGLGQGWRRSGRCRSGAFARDAVTAYLTRARPEFASDGQRELRSSSTSAAAGSPVRAARGCSRPAWRPRGSSAASRSTRCAIPSPPTCWRAAPTSGWCRSCWATRAWRPRRSTRW